MIAWIAYKRQRSTRYFNEDLHLKMSRLLVLLCALLLTTAVLCEDPPGAKGPSDHVQATKMPEQPKTSDQQKVHDQTKMHEPKVHDQNKMHEQPRMPDQPKMPEQPKVHEQPKMPDMKMPGYN
ncbi:IgA FC receptor-like [Danaus plexippus]|uniref:IgA FC receptor-like n=1 Tax=Danaus plexippus TaxID=13037 RepID=UPI002AB0B412|nr:IgA FC receptor-like [Danaus plexippus]